MKRRHKICIGICLLILAVVFGWLIIYITPELYKLHPVHNVASSVPEYQAKVTAVFSDTIKVKSDSLIIRHESTEINSPSANLAADNMADLGTFGDSAGFWNAIFSALAMAAVVITLWYQWHKDYKEEERARLAQFQEQCLTMLSMMSEIVSQLRISQTKATFEIGPSELSKGNWNPSSNQGISALPQNKLNQTSTLDITGRACFKYIYDERPEGRNIRDYILGYIVNNDEDPSDAIATENLYESLRKITETHFDHYFRTVYRIFKFIKESDLGDVKKEKQDDIRELCADLIRAQLSTYELAILYYNGLFPRYRNTSKKIYEHFCLFDNLDPDFLILPSEKEYYKEVRKNAKNSNAFDETIHYDCRAFTKSMPQSSALPVENESRKRKECFIRKWFLCGTGTNINGQTDIRPEIELTAEQRKVYNILKDNPGNVFTNKRLATRAHMKPDSLKRIVGELERKRLIRTENMSSGKRYVCL